MKRKSISFLMALTMIFSLFMSQAKTAHAENKHVNVEVTDFSVTKREGTDPISQLKWWEKFYIRMKWDASSYGKSLKKGDYFDVKLPEKMKFPLNGETSAFQLKDPHGSLVASAKVTANGDKGGGNVRVTFTDYVETHENIKGTMFLSAEFVQSKIKYNEKNEFKIEFNGKVKILTMDIEGKPGKVDDNEVLTKWSYANMSQGKIVENKANWTVRLNYKKSNLNNAVIEDELTVENGSLEGIHYISESFRLREVEFNSQGYFDHKTAKNIDLSGKLTFNAQKTAFKINLGNVVGKQYYLEYTTTYKPGLVLKNRIKVTARDFEKIVSSRFKSAKSGGDAQGDLLNKIKIIKVDAENNQKKIKGAEFLIKSLKDGTSFKLISDENGEAISDKLSQGNYTIEEIKAPSGYIKDGQKYTVHVTDGDVTILTIKNKKEKTKVKVKKTWIGLKKKSVTVRLLANGKEVPDKTLVLDENCQWQGQFDNLDKYDDNQKLIEYTVKEDKIDNYVSKITGNAENGFVIENINTEKISIPVRKRWIGPAMSSVKIKLKADGIVKEVYELKASEGWMHTFTNLDKYDPSTGKEIKYEVEEINLANYTSKVSGDHSGFVITNTNIEKISISVKKKWVGEETKSIVIHLFADGKKIASQKLTKANNWQYTFTNLMKYKNGKEIVYEVKEEKINGYKTVITGNAKTGFVITNTQDKPKIPGKKRPKTFDGSHYSLYTLLMTLSLLGIVLSKRKKKFN